MKKIFYILASAIVALGAVACENDGLDNIGLEVNGDTVSFVASIDNTKTALNGLETIWDEDDTIVVEWNGTPYEFKNSSENVNKFSCKADGLSAIKNANVVATYSHNNDGNIDSTAGTAGALLTYTGSFADIKFTVQNAFLKFTATESVTISADSGLFSAGTELTFSAGEHYVAINANAVDAKAPKKYTLSYRVGDIARDKAEYTPIVGKIYLLGELKKPTFTDKKVSLFPGTNWKSSSAWFAAYFYNETNTPIWVKMSYNNGKYECSIPEGFEGKKMILVRMDGKKTALNWSSRWNQTNDLTVPTTVYTTYYFDNDGWEKDEIQARWCQMLYLKPSDNWKESNARFAAYFCNGSKTAAHWWSMTVATTGIYQVPRFEGDDSKNIIFCRMNPGNTTNNWDNKWNQTADLTFPTDNKVLFVPTKGWWNDMGDGCWETLQ